jgi:hypothetical protein
MSELNNCYEKIKHLETENKDIQIRVGELIKEHQTRIDVERTTISNLKSE